MSLESPNPVFGGNFNNGQKNIVFRPLTCTDAAIKLIKDNLPGTWQSFGVDGNKIFVQGKFNPQDKTAEQFFKLCLNFMNDGKIDEQTMQKILAGFKPVTPGVPAQSGEAKANSNIVSKIIEHASEALKRRKETAEILGHAVENDAEVQKAQQKLLAWEKKYGVSAASVEMPKKPGPATEHPRPPIEAVQQPVTSGPEQPAAGPAKGQAKEGGGQTYQEKIVDKDQNISTTPPPATGGSMQTISLTKQFKLNISGSNFSDEAQYFGANDAKKIHVFFMGNYQKGDPRRAKIEKLFAEKAQKQGDACLVIWQEVHGKTYSKKGVLELVAKLGESYDSIDIHGHSNGASGGVSEACSSLIDDPKIGKINLISSYLDRSFEQDKAKAQNLIDRGKVHFFNAQNEANGCTGWQRQRGLAPGKVRSIDGVGHDGVLLLMIPKILNPKASA